MSWLGSGPDGPDGKTIGWSLRAWTLARRSSCLRVTWSQGNPFRYLSKKLQRKIGFFLDYKHREQLTLARRSRLNISLLNAVKHQPRSRYRFDNQPIPTSKQSLDVFAINFVINERRQTPILTDSSGNVSNALVRPFFV